MELIEKIIELDFATLPALVGPNDVFMKLIENKINLFLNLRGNILSVKGTHEEVNLVSIIFNELSFILKKNGTLEKNDVETVLELTSTTQIPQRLTAGLNATDSMIYWGSKEAIKTRSPKQRTYCEKVLNNDMVFAIGPAGTGKTYLAVAMALAALRRNEASKIVLSRPAVEAGESLGFLPGDLKEKLDPYLRPLLDALYIMLGPEKLKILTDKNIIEIIPLAYMRGRTISNSFIILDEAQNATITQMKMFLTRLGENSKAIITGDITQIDLRNKRDSGLINANKILHNIGGIEFVYFDEMDVVRHRLVTEIIKAYEREENEHI